jgi:hypothetical protein
MCCDPQKGTPVKHFEVLVADAAHNFKEEYNMKKQSR